MKDASGQMASAEIMFVIDSSQSMDRYADPGKCVMYTNNDPINGDKIRPHAQRLCYAKTAAIRLIEIAAKKNLPIKIGYQLFSSYDKTLENFDSDHNFYRFRELTDIRDSNARVTLEANLIGPCTGQNCQMQEGTAMGLGVEKAERELERGDPNTAKYIILMSDGDENVLPNTSGCRGNSVNGSWPDEWPPQGGGCAIFDSEDICSRIDNYTHPSVRILTPEMVAPALRQNMINFCNTEGRTPCAVSCKEMKDTLSWCSPSDLLCIIKYAFMPWYEGSPAYEAQQNGIKVFSIGYYGGGSNADSGYMEQIARHLYSPQQPGEISGYYAAESDSSYLYQVMEDILGVVSNQYNGAPFTIVETLPPGASVNRSVNRNDVSIWRDGVDLGLRPTLGSDGQRQTITYNIGATNYSSQTNPNTQTFEVRIQNIQYSCSGNFDADQNWSADGVEFADNEKPSKVIWTFPASGRDPVTKYMPRGLVKCVTQYSGDIYGTSISNYAFPGIDVSVAKGPNSSTGAVWSLANYNFSSSSYLNYDDFKIHFDKVIKDLENRAETLRNLDQIFTDTNRHPDLNPNGAVWHATGNLANLTITGPKTIGKEKNQRATVIVDGNLDFNNLANIAQLPNSNNNLLFIVKGNVTIDASTVGVENVAIIAPNMAPYGTITVGDSAMNIKGILAARNVVLGGGTTSGRQRIHYDTSFAIYPPPGLSSIDLPIFKEVKP